jgi:hypothetical protein
VDKSIIYDEEEIPSVNGDGKRPQGRPSKGGAAMRAKRYYAKKHLLILQKRKLKRYYLRVKKTVADHHFHDATVKSKLEEGCNEYKDRYDDKAS